MAIYDAKLMREHLRKALFLPRLAGTALSAPPLDSMASSATRSPPHSRNQHPRGIGCATRCGPLPRICWGMRLTAAAIAFGLPAALVSREVFQ